jgi:hypothetical protein
MRIRELLTGPRGYQPPATMTADARPELAAAIAPRQVGPASWANEPNHLNAIVWHDLTGTELPLTRAAVMAIPAVARQRHLICGALARCPLRGYDAQGNETTETWHWMWRTDKAIHPYHRMLWTVDDILFYGWSVWSAEREAGTRRLLWGDRIHPDRWEIDDVGRVFVDDGPARADEVVAIPGPHEGILNFGAQALTRTINNLEAAATAARNPSAYLELHYVGDDPIPDTEVEKHIARWAAARRGEHGGVAWTNKAIELREHGTHESHLLIEGRNADAVDVSRLVSSPSAMADATSAGASLTYETTEGRNGQFIDHGVGLYMDAIAARLSMDDVVARGQRTAFDTTELRAKAPTPTGSRTND